MSRRVVTTPVAEAQIASIDDWWRAHRPAAPGLFLAEFQEAVGILADLPFAGARYPLSPIAGVRRLLLTQSRYHVYYVVLIDVVIVLAVWHASRGEGPTFER